MNRAAEQQAKDMLSRERQHDQQQPAPGTTRFSTPCSAFAPTYATARGASRTIRLITKYIQGAEVDDAHGGIRRSTGLPVTASNSPATGTG